MSWAHCHLGHRHWGRRGAAGVLLVRGGLVMLQERGRVQLGGTWSIPGGAIEAGETPEQAARREAWEEVGLRDLEPFAAHVADCGGWAYTTFLATSRGGRLRGGWETARLTWFEHGSVHGLADLHPGFAASWPALQALLSGTADEGSRASPRRRVWRNIELEDSPVTPRMEPL